MRARVEDVDLERGMWTIPKSKSLAGRRTLRLTAEARSILGARIAAAQASGWLFEGKKADTHLKDVENSHQSVLEATGLRFVLYDLRHTFATRFYEATRDLEALRKVLGHANLRTILKYVHVSVEHVDSAMAIFENSFRVKSGSNGIAEMGETAITSANHETAGTRSLHRLMLKNWL